MTKREFPVTKTGVDGWYDYRGIRIVRNDQERGYSGHWTANVRDDLKQVAMFFRCETRGQLLSSIDWYFKQKER